MRRKSQPRGLPAYPASAAQGTRADLDPEVENACSLHTYVQTLLTLTPLLYLVSQQHPRPSDCLLMSAGAYLRTQHAHRGHEALLVALNLGPHPETPALGQRSCVAC